MPATPPDSGDASKVIPILMPQVGNSMEEGTILAWKVQPGDRIKPGDILYEVETDKANVEIESSEEGRLARIVAPVGAIVPIKEPVAYLAENDADVEALLASEGGVPSTEDGGASPHNVTPAQKVPTQQPAAPAAAPAAAPQTEQGRLKASPYARNLAQQRGVDLEQVPAGRGPGGRILAQDVPQAAAAPAPAASPTQAAGGEIRTPMSKMRKAIALGLGRSKQTIPHFYLKVTVDADPMLAFYRQEKAKYPCSVNDLIVLACSRVLQEFPAFRSRVDGDVIVTLPHASIGVAVGTDDGLVVPVVQKVETLTLQQLAAESRRVIEAARAGRLEGIGKGVFTISNLGMFGVDEFSAIINPPEAAILAVGAARETVIVSGGTLRAGRTMNLTVSCDHRVVDGLAAAKFMARLKELLELPQLLG